jgi:hypothetical protein
MKGKQTHIRKLWTINTLLDGEEKNQTQIVNELNQIGKKLKQINTYGIDNTEANQLITTTKPIETPIIKDLTNKKILKGQLKDLKGSNLKANFCFIPFNQTTFIKILNEIENSNIAEKQKNFFVSQLISSELGHKIINKELITKFLQKNQIYVKFEEDEKKIIKFTLLKSPQALKYSILSIQNQQEEWKINEAKDFYLFKLHLLLCLDSVDQSISQNENIEFKTNISFNQDNKSYKPLSTEITSENEYFYISQNFKKTKTLDQI